MLTLSGAGFLVLGGLVLFTVIMGLLARQNGITYQKGGRTYVGFVGISAIAMMDLLASVFYGPGEAFRYVGYDAMFFLILTSVLIALYAFSMTEIAEILEGLGQKGGGVYTVTYLVFGQTLSMIAVASILVDYINMAALSSISAVENFSAVVPIREPLKIPLELVIVWALAIINLIGIRASVWTTFGVFMFLGYALVAAAMLGLGGLNADVMGRMVEGIWTPVQTLRSMELAPMLGYLVIGVGSTILAYSGIETVLQTQKAVENWKVIRKAYLFLVGLNGLLIPAVGILAIAHVPNPGAHVEGLITYYALEIGGQAMGVIMVLAAALALAFAMNTAFVGGTELLTAIAERYGLAFLLRTNRVGAHYVIILFLALTFTVLILITQGSATLVSDMFAVGLLASFVLNLLALVVYRFTEGYTVMKSYRTSVVKNVFLILAFAAALVYVAMNKVHGTMLWVGAAVFMIALGFIAARFLANPDVRYETQFNTMDEVLAYVERLPGEALNVRFARPREQFKEESDTVYITLALLRLRPPGRRSEGHFVLPYSSMWGVVKEMEAVIGKLRQAHPEKRLIVHFGWPLSSWWERLSMGLMVHRLVMMPKRFPDLEYHIDYVPRAPKRRSKKADGRRGEGRDRLHKP
ncbi:MAG: amino acid permease [Hydrogenibacillus sp.]|nr:amino acid permease [Hydrogenibacillus sp.]